MAWGRDAFAFASGLLWVANGGGYVTAIDPAANTIVGQPVQIGEDVDALAASPGGLWLTTYETGTVALIDSESRAAASRWES